MNTHRSSSCPLALALITLWFALPVEATTTPAWRHLDERLEQDKILSDGQNPSEPGKPPTQSISNEEEEIRARLAQPSNHADDLTRLGDIELRRGDWVHASEHFYAAAQSNGANGPALSGLAVCLLAENSVDPAIKLLEEMERKSLLSLRDRANLAFAYQLRNRLDDSARQMERVLQEIDQAPWPNLKWKARCASNLALVKTLSQRPEEAAAWLRKASTWETPTP